MNRLIPVGKIVLVHPSDPEEKSEGGVHLPSSRDQLVSFGRCVSVGGEVDKVQEGSYVAWFTRLGVEFLFKGHKYVILRESDIFATDSGD